LVEFTTPTPSLINQQPSKKSRKSTGKRLRFEIFKRDGFTCQYCGAQPPDVVLVVDHIHPVAAGGTSDPLNLITACETCNQGKSDKTLGDRIVRPDADLMYLETQQEVAELARYRVSLRNRMDAVDAILGEFRDLWILHENKGYEPPRWLDDVLRQLLMEYDPESVQRALTNVAQKVAGGYLGYGQDTARYLRAVVRNMAAEGDDS